MQVELRPCGMWFCGTRDGKVALRRHIGLNERVSAQQGLAQRSVNTSLGWMHGDVLACDLIDSVMRVLQRLLCHHSDLPTHRVAQISVGR